MQLCWILLTVTLLLGFVPFGRCQRISNSLDDIDFDAILNESMVDEKGSRQVDPHGSWLRFVRRSEKSSEKTRKKRKKSNSLLPGPPGPSGPAGPRGPAGPPGAQITVEQMMEEFRKHVKAEADRRVEQIIHSRCPTCHTSGFKNLRNETIHLLELGELQVIPRIAAGFHVILEDRLKVVGRTFLELKRYLIPHAEGAFERGVPFDTTEGRFRASRTGVYQFTANLHMSARQRRASRDKIKRRDHVRVLVCIQSLCQKHTSLEHISPLHQDTKAYTTSLTGVLSLKRGQYASIYIDNSSTRPVSILQGSTFSGVLLGM